MAKVIFFSDSLFPKTETLQKNTTMPHLRHFPNSYVHPIMNFELQHYLRLFYDSKKSKKNRQDEKLLIFTYVTHVTSTIGIWWI